MMKTEVTITPRHVTIAMTGALEITAVPDLRARYQELLSAGYTRFLVDLSGLTYVDSSGLGALIGLLKGTKGKGGAVAYYGAAPAVKRIFELTRLDLVLPVYPDRRQAEAASE